MAVRRERGGAGLGPGQVLQAPRVRVAKPLELRLPAALSAAIRALREANGPDAPVVDERGAWLPSALADLLAEATKLSATVTGSRNGTAPDAVTDSRNRTCEVCGRSFPGVRADARYCSGACRQRAYRSRGEVSS